MKNIRLLVMMLLVASSSFYSLHTAATLGEEESEQSRIVQLIECTRAAFRKHGLECPPKLDTDAARNIFFGCFNQHGKELADGYLNRLENASKEEIEQLGQVIKSWNEQTRFSPKLRTFALGETSPSDLRELMALQAAASHTLKKAPKIAEGMKPKKSDPQLLKKLEERRGKLDRLQTASMGLFGLAQEDAPPAQELLPIDLNVNFSNSEEVVAAFFKLNFADRTAVINQNGKTDFLQRMSKSLREANLLSQISTVFGLPLFWIAYTDSGLFRNLPCVNLLPGHVDWLIAWTTKVVAERDAMTNFFDLLKKDQKVADIVTEIAKSALVGQTITPEYLDDMCAEAHIAKGDAFNELLDVFLKLATFDLSQPGIPVPAPRQKAQGGTAAAAALPLAPHSPQGSPKPKPRLPRPNTYGAAALDGDGSGSESNFYKTPGQELKK